MLRSKFFSADQVAAIVKDYRNAGLEPAEVAMMVYAEKITMHAYKATQQDVDDLRTHGFSDEEILDSAFVTAARNMFSKLIDALGAEPDDALKDIDEDLRAALTVGRPLGGKR